MVKSVNILSLNVTQYSIQHSRDVFDVDVLMFGTGMTVCLVMVSRFICIDIVRGRHMVKVAMFFQGYAHHFKFDHPNGQQRSASKKLL